MLTKGEVLSPADFFAGLRKRLKTSLPPSLRNFSSGRGRGRLMKVHYARPEFHFEAWHHTGDGRLEVGLHFEGEREQNQRAFDFFRSQMVAIKSDLPRAELEPWDRGWTRLYETLSAPHLDGDVLDRAAVLMTSYIVTLQPLVELLAAE